MTEQDMAVIGHRVSALETDRNEILQVLKELNVAVNKLVIIDERQSTDRAHERIDAVSGEMGSRIDTVKTEITEVTSALGKSVGALRSEAAETHKQLEGRLDELEKAEVENKRVRGWVFALIAVIGLGVAGALLKLIGLSV